MGSCQANILGLTAGVGAGVGSGVASGVGSGVASGVGSGVASGVGCSISAENTACWLSQGGNACRARSWQIWAMLTTDLQTDAPSYLMPGKVLHSDTHFI